MLDVLVLHLTSRL